MLQPTSSEAWSIPVEETPIREVAAGPTGSNSQRAELCAGKLRVLHVFNHLGLGGTELTALRLIANLGSGEFEHVVCPLKGYDSEMAARLSPGSEVIVPPGAVSGFQFMIPRLTKVMKAVRPHIVHSRNRGAVEAIAAARLAGVPVVIHSEHGYEMTNLHGLPLRQRLVRCAMYPLADTLVTVSRELQNYHCRQAWISRDRIRVIENGIDTQLFTPTPHTRSSIREKIGIPQGRFVIGTVGRLVAIKGQRILLDAVEMTVRQGVNVHALIVGAGPELECLKASVGTSSALSGRVSFIGAVENVPAILNAMDAFVLPSFSEGMSNTLIEAMACGLPVLASRVGGNPEVMEENQSGLLFEPGNADGICKLLLNLANDEERRKTLGMQARRQAVQRFGLMRMVEDYRRLYIGLARKRRILTRSNS